MYSSIKRLCIEHTPVDTGEFQSVARVSVSYGSIRGVQGKYTPLGAVALVRVCMGDSQPALYYYSP